MSPGQDTWTEELQCGCKVRMSEGDESHTVVWCDEHRRPLRDNLLDEIMTQIDELVSAPTEDEYQKARGLLKRFIAASLGINRKDKKVV